ncbi:MAG: hypothetical protein HS103_06375 [Anaerolineales bacterium]|nr:hypothetical protein [Anaerolineales bacterium]
MKQRDRSDYDEWAKYPNQKEKATATSKISVALPKPIGKAKYPKKTPQIPLTAEGYELLTSEASNRGYDFTPFLTQILESVAKDIKKMRADQEDAADTEDDYEDDYDPEKITQQSDI